MADCDGSNGAVAVFAFSAVVVVVAVVVVIVVATTIVVLGTALVVVKETSLAVSSVVCEVLVCCVVAMRGSWDTYYPLLIGLSVEGWCCWCCWCCWRLEVEKVDAN